MRIMGLKGLSDAVLQFIDVHENPLKLSHARWTYTATKITSLFENTTCQCIENNQGIKDRQ